MSNSGSSPPSGHNGGWWSRMSRSEQTMAAIAGAVVAGIFAVIVSLIGHSSGSSQDPQAGQPISVAKSPRGTRRNMPSFGALRPIHSSCRYRQRPELTSASPSRPYVRHQRA
jgi:hypothetical protein